MEARLGLWSRGRGCSRRAEGGARGDVCEHAHAPVPLGADRCADQRQGLAAPKQHAWQSLAALFKRPFPAPRLPSPSASPHPPSHWPGRQLPPPLSAEPLPVLRLRLGVVTASRCVRACVQRVVCLRAANERVRACVPCRACDAACYVRVAGVCVRVCVRARLYALVHPRLNGRVQRRAACGLGQDRSGGAGTHCTF